MKLAAIAKLIKADGYCKLYKVFYDDCRSLHHFDVVNYTEDPPVRPYWGKYCGILKEDYYGCPICGYITNWQPETCPVCHTRLEMWDGKGKGA